MSQWVSGTLRDVAGNPHSPAGAAASVYLDDGRTVKEALSSLDAQEISLSQRLASLAAAVDAVTAAAPTE